MKTISTAAFNPKVLLSAFFLFSLCLSNVIAQNTEMVKRSVVKLTVVRPNKTVETGAGILVGASGEHVFILASLQYVIGEGELDYDKIRVGVQFQSQNKPLMGKLFRKFHSGLDLAVVYVKLARPVNINSLPQLSIGNPGKLKEPDEIITIGHTPGNPWQLSAGTISQIDSSEIRYAGDAVYSGNTGSALINSKGALIGLATKNAAENGFALRIDVALAKLNEWHIPVYLQQTGKSKKWWLIGGGAVAAAIGGIYAATRNGDGGETGAAVLSRPPQFP